MAGGGLFDQVLRAGAVFVTGAFVSLTLARRGALLPRALAAVALGTLALGLWLQVLGIQYTDVEASLARQLRAGYQGFLDGVRTDPRTQETLRRLVAPLIERAPDVARFYPAVVCLQALAGLALAWVWYHRIAATPLGPEPAPFRAFRFNDHLVWGAILTSGLLLLPLPAAATAAAGNLLILWIGLYAARGFAVLAAFLAALPALVKGLGLLVGLLLMPFSMGTLVAFGLADTWLDFRGRLAPPPPSGGSD